MIDLIVTDSNLVERKYLPEETRDYGNPVPDAMVYIQKDDKIIFNGTTNSEGKVSVDVEPGTEVLLRVRHMDFLFIEYGHYGLLSTNTIVLMNELNYYNPYPSHHKSSGLKRIRKFFLRIFN